MRYHLRQPMILALLLPMSLGGLGSLAPRGGTGAILAAHARSTIPSSASVRPAARVTVTYYVNQNSGNASDGNPCTAPGSPCRTIGAAIAKSGAGDTVVVAAGTYGEGLTIAHDLTLQGAGAGQTVIDGSNNTGNSGSVVAVTATVEIAQVTIQGGHAATYGGGIDNAGTLALIDSTVVNNSTAFIGGGIFNDSNAMLTIENSAIGGNSAATGAAPYGGGIYNTGAMTLTASAVSGNNAGGNGGGIYNDGSSVTLIASTVSDNTAGAGSANGQAGHGGGIETGASTLTLVNSTVSGNSATRSGGGIGEGGDFGTVASYNSTISGNSALNGGGVFVGGGVTANLANTIVAANTNPAVPNASGPDCQGTLTSQDYNLLGNNSGCTLVNAAGAGAPGDQIGTPAQPINPLLGPLQNNGGPTLTQALLPGSPAIDAGNPGGCRDGRQNLLTTDQRGQPRPDSNSGRCDIGAFERQPDAGPTATPSPSPVPPTATNTNTNTPTATNTRTNTPTATNTNTRTNTPTATNTNTNTPTATNTKTNTPIPPTVRGTSVNTATPTNTPSPSPTTPGGNAATGTATPTTTGGNTATTTAVATTNTTVATTNTPIPLAITQTARSSTPTVLPSAPTATVVNVNATTVPAVTTAVATRTKEAPAPTPTGRGIIRTVAGTRKRGYGRAGEQATKAPLAGPQGVAVDGDGNLFIADTLNNVARDVGAASHDIGTVAGSRAPGFHGDGGPADRARLFHLGGIARDGHGNLFIVDTYNNRVREVEAGSGRIRTVAGTGHNGYRGDGGPAADAWLSAPQGIAVDSHDRVYIADMGNSRVRAFTVGGDINTIAGVGRPGRNAGFGRDGLAATKTLLDFPRGVAVDDAGNIFIADTGSNRVREVEAGSGRIVTVAGNGRRGDSVGRDHKAVHATLNQPMGVAVDGAGDVFIADTGNNKVREVSACTGDIAAVAGTGRRGDSGDGGPAVEARLAVPIGVALDQDGNLYIADSLNNAIREVEAVGRAHTSCLGAIR